MDIPHFIYSFIILWGNDFPFFSPSLPTFASYYSGFCYPYDIVIGYLISQVENPSITF